SPEAWLAALPLYAELRRGEGAFAGEHLTHGVPDLRVATLPGRFDELLQRDLPLDGEEIGRLRSFVPRFEELCTELEARDVPETVQHDDLHLANCTPRISGCACSTGATRPSPIPSRHLSSRFG